jgi:class 3 adenylate cyclase
MNKLRTAARARCARDKREGEGLGHAPAVHPLDELARDYQQNHAAIMERRCERDRASKEAGDAFVMVFTDKLSCAACGAPITLHGTAYTTKHGKRLWHTWCYPLHR